LFGPGRVTGAIETKVGVVWHLANDPTDQLRAALLAKATSARKAELA
jgi:hypothetical protein